MGGGIGADGGGVGGGRGGGGDGDGGGGEPLVVGAMAMAAAACWLVVVAAAMLWPRRRSRGEGAHPLQPLPRPQAETGGVIRQRPSVRPRDDLFVSLRCNAAMNVRGKILRKRGE